MSAVHESPLDERTWGDINTVSFFGSLNTDTVPHYFIESPFCDPTSTNTVQRSVLSLDASTEPTLRKRETFEAHLRKCDGIRYLVIQDPTVKPKQEARAKSLRYEPPFVPDGTWVVRKEFEDKAGNVKYLGYYYITGITIFPAPSIANLLSARLLSTYQALTSTMATAITMPQFSAARGHYYESATPSSRPSASARTAQASKEATPMPDNTSTITASASKRTTANQFGAGLLMDSLNLSLRYREEYMDENPLSGVPGSFKINKLRPDGTLVEQKLAAKANTPLPPPPIDTSAAVANPLSKGAKGAEKSPTTPGGTKKRKRSKAASAATPK